MKEKWMQKFLVGFLGIITIAGIGTTAAYFSDYEKVVNQLVVGRNVTEIEEDFPGPTPTPTDTGTEYKKIVQVSNQSEEESTNVDCYVRVLVTFSDYDIGQAVTLIGLDTDNWIYNEADGYYYYKNILKRGCTTTALFTGFKVEDAKVDIQYLESIKNFHINVYEESVQSGGFTDYQEAWDYYLNPIKHS